MSRPVPLCPALSHRVTSCPGLSVFLIVPYLCAYDVRVLQGWGGCWASEWYRQTLPSQR
jgi:hypothetical protein